MKDEIFRKGVIICLICLLMLPTIVAGKESNYNLKIRIKNTKLVYEPNANFNLSVNISNEGPDSSDNYSVEIEIFYLYYSGLPIRKIFKFTGAEETYTGLSIAPHSYDKTLVNCINPGRGWYLVRAIVNSEDTNSHDNVSYRIIHITHAIF